jgi:hypothetical protein
VTVAIGVLAVTGEVGKEGGTALKLGRSRGDTSVDHVHTRAGSGGGVVGVGGGTSLAGLVGNTRQAPGGRALRCVGLLLKGLKLSKVGLDDSILLNVFDLQKSAREQQEVIREVLRQEGCGSSQQCRPPFQQRNHQSYRSHKRGQGPSATASMQR